MELQTLEDFEKAFAFLTPFLEKCCDAAKMKCDLPNPNDWYLESIDFNIDTAHITLASDGKEYVTRWVMLYPADMLLDTEEWCQRKEKERITKEEEKQKEAKERIKKAKIIKEEKERQEYERLKQIYGRSTNN